MAKKAKHMEVSSQQIAIPQGNGVASVWQPTLTWKVAIR